MGKNKSFLENGRASLLIVVLLVTCSSPSPENYIILTAGDSLTEVGYPPYLERTLKEEGIRSKIINYGKSGHTSGEFLRFLESKKSEMEGHRPDFILLQLGTNDVRIDHDQTKADIFYNHMKKIIQIFRGFKTRKGKSPRLLLGTVPPIPDGTPFPFSPLSKQRVSQEINPIIQKIAVEEECLVVDNYSLFLVSPHLLPEVHPSREGYEAMAKNWRNALKKLSMKAAGKNR